MRGVAPVVAVAVLLAAAATAPAKVIKCGNIHVQGTTYPVHVLRGHMGCVAARGTLTGYLRSFRQPSGWFCVLGHSHDLFAARCARRQRVGTVIEALNPPGRRP